MSGIIEVDIHGRHPRQIMGLPLQQLVEQAWRSGATQLVIIHGHGHHRGGPVVQGSGRLGSRVRAWLQRDYRIGHYIKRRTIDCSNPGITSVELQKNPSPVASSFAIESILPPARYEVEEALA
jgi:hypothetical protein